ncbi:MAG: site-2 protease family protein [bacterium]|jgi:Zn-dependent protease|nr:site-2 protease family protein [bacterium]
MESLLISLPVLIFSVIVHEVAHGWTALRLGDPTAWRAGRLTLDPRPHIDPFMSLLVPAMCILSGAPVFGGAKPVPVNPWHFRHPSRDMAIVAAAGPASNLVLAFLAGFLINRLPAGLMVGALPDVLFALLVINLVLAAFNLLPLPPLDGSRVVAHFLPAPLADRYRQMDRFGMILLVLVIVFLRAPLLGYLHWFLRTVGGLMVS